MELGLKGRTVILSQEVVPKLGISLAFARGGVKLSIADIDEAQAEKTAARARELGAQVLVVPTDVTDWGQVQVRKTLDAFGDIGVLVNNVGWTVERPFVEKPRSEWEREVQLNLWGMINCTRAALDRMIARRKGAVVSIGPGAGRVGEFCEGVYAACKAGVIALTKTLAREVGRYGIRLNVVCPETTMPESEEEVGEKSMWAGSFGKGWNTPEMRERIARMRWFSWPLKLPRLLPAKPLALAGGTP